VLGYHHPLDIAKRFGTLDRISGGRLVLGFGVGYLQQEFELLGVPFADRGARADDAIRAVRASFGRPMPEYDGPYYRFSGMVIDPCGVQEDVPIWIGGRTRRSLRRAVELGDAWWPFAVSPRRAGGWLAEAASTEAWERRERPLEVVLASPRALDPVGAPDATAELVRSVIGAGASTLSVWFAHDSLDHYLEQMEAMVGLAAEVS
jgi:alkanesulfonate monooxygenase SsuD/methylene tetrahydromethanopterin reductase-like flavin-dependent oxidoreductase (luciferase family)